VNAEPIATYHSCNELTKTLHAVMT